MRIKEKTYQHRRDFKAIYECEFCGDEVNGKGYDDSFFHENVIPDAICDKCGKKSGVVTSKPDQPDWVVL